MLPFIEPHRPRLLQAGIGILASLARLPGRHRASSLTPLSVYSVAFLKNSSL